MRERERELVLNDALNSLFNFDILHKNMFSHFTNSDIHGFNLKTPFNIYQENEDSVYIEIALAGFSRDEIEVNYNERNNYLEIIAEHNEEEKQDNKKYFQRGISKKNIKRVFSIGEESLVDPDSITYKNGILSIKIIKKEKPPENVKKLQIK